VFDVVLYIRDVIGLLRQQYFVEMNTSWRMYIIKIT